MWNSWVRVSDAHWYCFPSGSVVKNLPANVGDTGSIPGLGRCPGEGNGKPFQYSCLENSMDRGSRQLQSMGSQRVKHNCATDHTCNINIMLFNEIALIHVQTSKYTHVHLILCSTLPTAYTVRWRSHMTDASWLLNHHGEWLCWRITQSYIGACVSEQPIFGSRSWELGACLSLQPGLAHPD